MGVTLQDRSLETEIFERVFESAYGYKGRFDERVTPLFSPKILKTDHAPLLYQLAKQLRPDGNNEELFAIMQELNAMETVQERLRLRTFEQAGDLMNRYLSVNPKEEKPKTRMIKHF